MRKIFYEEAGNSLPAANASADVGSGPVPLAVTFNATGSSDPNAGDTLTYFWDFGDGTPEASTTSLTIGHTYTRPGIYTATLRARDNHFAFSAPDTVAVDAVALDGCEDVALGHAAAVDRHASERPGDGAAQRPAGGKEKLIGCPQYALSHGSPHRPRLL